MAALLPSTAEAVAPAQERIVDPWLLCVAILWGLNAVPTKWVLEVMEPAGVLLFRYVTCAVVISAVVWAQGRGRPAPGPRPWGTMLLVGVWVAAQQLIFMYAFDWTSASEASLIISIAPIWTAMIGAAWGAEAFTAGNWLGTLGAAAGVALIVFGGDGMGTGMPTRVQGDVWMILSSLGYGSFMVYSKGVMRRHGSLSVMAWAFVYGSLLVVPAGAAQFCHADWAHFGLLQWGSLLFTALVSGGFGFIVWYRTIARTSPAKTAVYQYLVPVVSLAAAAVFLAESLTWLQIAGAFVVMLGLVLARAPAPDPA